MAWEDLASNQMVSFTDAQTSGFTLKSGQSHVTSNQCMTKSEILTKYNVTISGYADNQLVPKSAWDARVCISYKVEIPKVDTVTISYYDCNNNPVVLEPLTGPDSIQFCAKEGTVLRVPDNTSVITSLGNCQPVNCVVSEWSAWSTCTNGSQTRTRTVITPASNGGTACPVLTESRSCEPVINCVVSEWSAWSTCSEGFRTRTRTVITPASGGGMSCPVLTETESCTRVAMNFYDDPCGTTIGLWYSTSEQLYYTSEFGSTKYTGLAYTPLTFNQSDWEWEYYDINDGSSSGTFIIFSVCGPY